MEANETMPAGDSKRRWMRLPKNPAYPHFSEVHLEDDWCKKAGCIPTCAPRAYENTAVTPVALAEKKLKDIARAIRSIVQTVLSARKKLATSRAAFLCPQNWSVNGCFHIPTFR